MAELNDYEIAGDNDVCDGLETALLGIGAGRATGSGIIDHFKVERVFEVFSPAWKNVRQCAWEALRVSYLGWHQTQNLLTPWWNHQPNRL